MSHQPELDFCYYGERYSFDTSLASAACFWLKNRYEAAPAMSNEHCSQ